MMMMILIISAPLSIMLIILNSMISEKLMNSQEMYSPFECGFEPKTSSRLPFSLQFYLISVIFLIFDVEITLLIPLPTIINQSQMINWTLMSITFMWILIMGLFYEWTQGSLNWMK